jgi:hypothetical protein
MIVLFVSLALLTAFLAWKYTFKKSETSVASRKEDVETDASRLIQEFEADEMAANTKYLDRIVLVSGTIGSIAEDSLGISVYLKEADALSGVICSFEREVLDPASLTIGSPVKIKGICTGYLMDVVLNKCSLVNPGSPSK